MDFVLTIKSIAEKGSSLIFSGCLIAAYRSICKKPECLNKSMKNLIAMYPKSNETADLIISKLFEILQVPEDVSEPCTISI